MSVKTAPAHVRARRRYANDLAAAAVEDAPARPKVTRSPVVHGVVGTPLVLVAKPRPPLDENDAWVRLQRELKARYERTNDRRLPVVLRALGELSTDLTHKG